MIGLGGSLPIGSFGSKSFSNSNPGFAKPALTADFSYQYKLFKNHYIAASFNTRSNKFNNISYSDQLHSLNNSIIYSVRPDTWKIASFMIGACDLYNLDKKQSLLFFDRVLMGLSDVHSPAIFITEQPVGSNTSSWTSQESANANALSWMVDLGMQIKYRKRMSFFYLLRYSNIQPTFNNVSITNSSGATSTNSFKQNISLLEFQIGFLTSFK